MDRLSQDELMEIVNRKINKYGINNFNTLRPLLQQQILEIERYIQKCTKKQEECVKIFYENRITKQGISENVGMAWGSIFNNPETLKKYIDESIKENKKKDLQNKDALERLKKVINDKDILIDSLTCNLIYMNDIKIENDKLTTENDKQRKERDIFYAERKKLLHEIHDLERKVRDSVNNIVLPIKQE